MKKYPLLLSLFINLNLFAQVTSSVDAIEFPQVFTSTTDSSFFYIINHNEETALIELNKFKRVFALSDTTLTIPANDSIIIWLKYSPNQNVNDDDVILITSFDSTIGIAIDVFGIAKYGDGYDATTFNKYDTELKSVLTTLVNNHISLGYDLARDKMFMEIDNQRVNGQNATQNTLECVYTGRLAVGYIDRTDAFNNYSFNTEHTWPQSNFGEAEPMRSDLYHLFPTDITANSIRSNYPFGNVVSNITWQVGGSKRGNDSTGQIVFEPRDVHKGDVSRSMYYFITRYPVNYGNFFTQAQENVFREWNKLDPVGVIESNRNNAIASLQMKRNPYIDHPEFVDRIYSFATNNTRPRNSELDLIPYAVQFDSTNISDTTSGNVYLINVGNNSLNIDSIIVTDSHFILSNITNEVEQYSAWKSLVHFIPDSVRNYSATIIVYSDGGTKQISLSGIGKDDAVSVDDESINPLIFSLSQNYPNPFNPSTIISWQTPEASWQTLKLFNTLGQEVQTMVDEYLEAGFHSKLYIVNSTLPSGVYFYRLQAGSFIETKKMLMLK
jgi:hypothetical protein